MAPPIFNIVRLPRCNRQTIQVWHGVMCEYQHCEAEDCPDVQLTCQLPKGHDGLCQLTHGQVLTLSHQPTGEPFDVTPDILLAIFGTPSRIDATLKAMKHFYEGTYDQGENEDDGSEYNYFEHY